MFLQGAKSRVYIEAGVQTKIKLDSVSSVSGLDINTALSADKKTLAKQKIIKPLEPGYF